MNKTNQKTRQVGNGEGSLYHSDKLDCWVFQYHVNGKRKTIKQKKNEQSKQFKARVTTLKNELNTGTYIEKSKDTLLEILKNHIEQKKIDNLTTPASYKRNLETLEQLKKCCSNFISKPIQNIKIEDIEKSKIHLKLYSNSCIDKMWSLLNKGFKIAYSRRKIPFNIMEDETLTKPMSDKAPKIVEALTPNERKKLEYILDNQERHHQYRNAVKFQYISAMRIGEVLARSKTDYNSKEKTLHVHNTLTIDENGNTIIGKHTKTYDKKTGIDSGERVLHLHGIFKELNDIILEQLSKKQNNIYGLLFWDYRKNSLLTHSQINNWLKRINEKYNITSKPLSTHVLRHTAITIWREKKVDMKVIQYWAGHVEGSNITDDVYVSLTQEFIEQEQKNIL